MGCKSSKYRKDDQMLIDELLNICKENEKTIRKLKDDLERTNQQHQQEHELWQRNSDTYSLQTVAVNSSYGSYGNRIPCDERKRVEGVMIPDRGSHRLINEEVNIPASVSRDPPTVRNENHSSEDIDEAMAINEVLFENVNATREDAIPSLEDYIPVPSSASPVADQVSHQWTDTEMNTPASVRKYPPTVRSKGRSSEDIDETVAINGELFENVNATRKDAIPSLSNKYCVPAFLRSNCDHSPTGQSHCTYFFNGLTQATGFQYTDVERLSRPSNHYIRCSTKSKDCLFSPKPYIFDNLTGSCEQFRRLLRDDPSLLEHSDGNKQTILHFAVINGFERLLVDILARQDGRKLLRKEDIWGKTPFDWADTNDKITEILQPYVGCY